MPEDINIAVEIDAEEANQVLDDLIEKQKQLQEVSQQSQKQAQRQGRETAGGLQATLGVFGNLLPRSIMNLNRSFQSTQRSLRGFTSGIKILDKAVKGLGTAGFGILLIAIEQIIANWDQITALFDKTTTSARVQEEAMRKAALAVNDLTVAIDKHRQIVANFNETDQVRISALKELQRLMPELNDLTLDEADALSRINAARERRLELEQISTKVKATEQALQDTKNASLEDEVTWYDRLIYGQNAYLGLAKRQKKAKEDEKALNEDLNQLALEERRIMAEIEAELQAQREAAEAAAQAERDAAEAERKRLAEIERIAKEEERMLKERTQLLEELRTQAELDALEGQARLEREIELRREAELEKAMAVQASQEAIDLINAQYDAEQQQRIDNEIQRIKDLEQAAADAMMSAQERLDEALLTQDESELMRAAKKWDELLDLAVQYGLDTTELENKRQEELTLITEKQAAARAKIETDKEQTIQDAKMATLESSVKLFGTISDLAKRDSKLAKAAAVTQILLSQGKAIASGIEAAVTTTPKTPAYPFQLAANIAGILGTILSTFGQVRNILKTADTSMPGGGGGGSTSQPVQALIPTTASNTPGSQQPLQAFVVQSELQGMNLQHSSMAARTTL